MPVVDVRIVVMAVGQRIVFVLVAVGLLRGIPRRFSEEEERGQHADPAEPSDEKHEAHTVAEKSDREGAGNLRQPGEPGPERDFPVEVFTERKPGEERSEDRLQVEERRGRRRPGVVAESSSG